MAGKAATAGLLTDFGVNGLIDQLHTGNYLEEAFRRHGISPDKLKFLLDDDEIASCWEKRVYAVEHLKWGLTDPESELSLFIWSELNKWYATLASDLLTAVLYGLACPEITYKQDPISKKYIISHLQQHPTSWFAVDKRSQVHVIGGGEQVAIEGHPTYQYKFIPLIHRRTAHRPAGTPLLVSLVWVWFLRGNVWQFWAKYLERFGSPQWRGKAAPGFDPVTGKSNAESMADMLARAVSAGVVVVGTDEDADAVDASGGAGASFETADKRIDARIQRRILGQTLTTDNTSGTGSNAMAQVHDGVRQEIAASDIALITPALQRVVNNLTAINYPGQQPPILTIAHKSALSAERAKRDTDLYGQGVRFSEDYYNRSYDFEPGEVTVTDAPTPPAMPARFAAHKHGHYHFADAGSVADGQAGLDSLADAAIQQAGELMDAEEVQAIIAKAKNADDLAARLSDYWDKGQAKGDFMQALESLLFAADILGYEQADKGADNV